MTICRKTHLTLIVALISAILLGPSVARAESVTVNPNTSYNTVDGWEATAIWYDIASNDFHTNILQAHKDELAGIAVNQLGLDRIRLEIQTGAENPVDYWQQFFNGQIDYEQLKDHFFHKINDNNDPAVANASGFQFTYIDYQIENFILPMRQLLAANGEDIYINLCVVDFNNGRNGNNSNFSVGNSPAEYAELVNETFDHVARKYGLTIDALEIILEPDNAPDWLGASIGTKVGNNLVAAVNRLGNNGYTLNEVIAPSNAEMQGSQGAIATFDQMIQVPEVLGLLTTFNYHKYAGNTATNTQAIESRAQTHSLKTAMLEHFTDTHNSLIADLIQPRLSSYQRWAYAAPHSSAYISTDVTNPNNLVFGLHTGVHAMAQVFKYVRRNALQLQVTTGNGAAYINLGGSYVVVFRNTSFGPHTIDGLPAGVYGITSTGNDSGGSLATEVASADVTIGAGDTLSFSVATTGGLTSVFSKSLANPDTTPPNAPSNVQAN